MKPNDEEAGRGVTSLEHLVQSAGYLRTMRGISGLITRMRLPCKKMIEQHWILETGTVLQDMRDGVHEGVPEHARQKLQERIPTKLPDFIAYKKGRGPKRGITAKTMGLTLAMTTAKKRH